MHNPGGSNRRPWRMGRQLAGEGAAGGEDAKEGGGCRQEGKSAGLRLLPPRTNYCRYKFREICKDLGLRLFLC